MENVISVASATTRLGELRALRARLARAIDNEETPARDLSSLARRLMDVGVEIEKLEGECARDAGAVNADGSDDETWDPEAI